MIRNTGIEPTVIEYLKTPPNRKQLADLVARMKVPVRDILRQKGTPYDELGLGKSTWTDTQLLDAVTKYTILLNRPIVVTPLGAKLCRPSELVLDILPEAQKGEFRKEDGERVVDKSGRRAR